MPCSVLYVRQSKTSEEDSLSLEFQERILRDLAASRGWTVAAVYADPDRKGWEEDRPGLAGALDHCARGGVGHFLVYDVSRLSRSVRLLEQYVHRLGSLGVELVSSREPQAGTALYRQILGAIAEEASRTISANWRSVLRGRARRGLAHGTVPYGYRKPLKGGPLATDPPSAATVCELFRRYAAGDHISDLAVDLTRRGIPAPRGGDWWHTRTVAQILDNPVYAGCVVLNGERLEGAHEAIVSPDLFAVVADRRAEASRPLRHKPCSSWLEGHAYHECGSRMHLQCCGNEKPGERPRFRCWRLSHPHTPAGRCTVPRASIAAYLAEPIVRAQIAKDLGAILPLSEVVAAAKREARAITPSTADRRLTLEHRSDRVADRRHKAEELYLSGVRDRAWFDVQDASCATELAEVARELASLPSPPGIDEVRLTGARLREMARGMPRTADERMAALLAELGIVVVGADGVRVVYRGVYARHLAGAGETAEQFLDGS